MSDVEAASPDGFSRGPGAPAIGRAMTKLLRERFAFAGGAIAGTEDAPVIRGALLCGPTSANKRRYLKRAFACDRVKRYNGVPVFLNHGHGADGRPYQEQIGVIQNARHRADGMPIGDIAVNPKKPYAEAFLWDARHQPKACGMSHVAHCETTRAADGWDDVTELVRVESVDVISANNGATTKGLYESAKKRTGLRTRRHLFGSRTVSLTVKQLAEALVRHPRTRFKEVRGLKWLAELDGMDAAPTAVDVPPSDNEEPGTTLDQAFIDAAVAEMKECMAAKGDPDQLKKCLGKLKKMLMAHAEITADDTDTEDMDTDGTDGDTGNGGPDEEWRGGRAEGALSEAIAVCEQIRWTNPPSDDLKLIAGCTPSKRLALANRLKAAAEGTRSGPSSWGRGRFLEETGTGTTKATEGKASNRAQEFARLVSWN